MKKLLVVSIISLASLVSLAQDLEVMEEKTKTAYFNPYVSVLGGVGVFGSQATVYEGTFAYSKSNFTKGFELGNVFPMGDGFLLKVGIRYMNTVSTIHWKNQVSIAAPSSDALKWKSFYGSLSIPIAFAKEWHMNSGRTFEAFVGLTNGIMFHGAEKSMGSSKPYQTEDGEELKISNSSSVDHKSSAIGAYHLNADFGFAIQPFKQCDKLKIGAVASLQLNNVAMVTEFEGRHTVSTPTINESHNYKIDYKMDKISNVFLKLTYQF